MESTRSSRFDSLRSPCGLPFVQSISAALRFFYLHAAGIAGLLRAVIVGVDDLRDMLRRELVLALPFEIRKEKSE